MAIVFDGTTSLLRSGTIATSLQTELTLALWVRPDAVAGSSFTDPIGASDASSDAGLLGYLWGGGGNRNRAVVGDTQYVFYGTRGSDAAATWLHVCIVATGGVFRQYENGVLVGSQTTGAPSGTVTDFRVAAMCGVSAANRLAGKACMIGCWLAGLSAAEAAALGKGAAPHLVRPQSLRYYVQGLRDANPLIGTNNTATGLTYDGDNPRIYL